MNKVKFIAMGLTLPFLTNICLGQTRTCDLEITGFPSPVKDLVIPYGEKFFFTATIKNNGPDDIVPGDTLIYLTPMNPQEPLGAILDKGIPNGESIEYTFFELTNQNTTGEEQVYDEFCAMTIDPHRFFDKPGYIDPEDDNNQNCTSFSLASKEGTSSIASHEGTNLPLSVYPNPAIDKISISLESFQGPIYLVRLMDVSGREVLRMEATDLRSTTDNKVVLDVSGVSAGTYLIEVQAEGAKATTKVVIQD